MADPARRSPQNKTLANSADVGEFLDSIPDASRRSDARTLVEVMSRITGLPPVMWGQSIVGFGSYHYRYATGREGDAAALAFSPRKAATTVYLVEGFDKHAELLAKLGPHSVAKSCLYLKSLAAVDIEALSELLEASYRVVSAPNFGEFH